MNKPAKTLALRGLPSSWMLCWGRMSLPLTCGPQGKESCFIPICGSQATLMGLCLGGCANIFPESMSPTGLIPLRVVRA